MIEPEIETEVKLPWDVICQTACYAMCRGITMNEAMTRMIEHYMRRTHAETAFKTREKR